MKLRRSVAVTVVTGIATSLAATPVQAHGRPCGVADRKCEAGRAPRHPPAQSGRPGASGLTMPADLVGLGLPSSVWERYDLIGMDPRGVGLSAPVSCGFTGELD